MKLKDKLLKLKKDILLSNFKVLEDHPIGEQNIYRLRYINYSRIGGYHGKYNSNYEMLDCMFKPFMLPMGMTREEGFKVLSYLVDFIEEREDIEDCSLKAIKTLDRVLDLSRFGFTKVEEDNEDKIIDLFTVTGRISFFKKSELYHKYFEWYIPSVTKDEVENIYVKNNMEFMDIIFVNNEKYSKKLKK